jgi:hypothetical protein
VTGIRSTYSHIRSRKYRSFAASKLFAGFSYRDADAIECNRIRKVLQTVTDAFISHSARPIEMPRGKNSCHAGECLRVAAWYTSYRWIVTGALFANVATEPFPFTIASVPNGGPAFAGKSGRRTANACEAKAMETAIATTAHFMSGASYQNRTTAQRKIMRIGSN